MTWALVGLGNPGSKYEGTRHNVGEMVIRNLVEGNRARLKPSRKARCEVADWRLGDQRVIGALPGSYMNESGGPVASLLNFESVSPEHLVVVHDEIDLPFGSLRVKFGGGDNGHNGLRSIRKSLGTGDWFRVRVGVGRGRSETIGHVLSRFSGPERKALDDLIVLAGQACESLVTDGLASTQNRFNS